MYKRHTLNITLYLTLVFIITNGSAWIRGGKTTSSFTLGSCTLKLEEECDTENYTTFNLYTGGPDSEPMRIHLNGDPVPSSVFDPKSNTTLKVVIHGYAGNTQLDFTQNIVQEYLKVEGTAILAVNWSMLANMPCYPTASYNTWHVGRCTGRVVAKLLGIDGQGGGGSSTAGGSDLEGDDAVSKGKRRGDPGTGNGDVDNSVCEGDAGDCYGGAGEEDSGLVQDKGGVKVHAVGFSLGAHVAAYASNQLEQDTGRRFNRITGLDPALPFFATPKLGPKLDSTDADFVDVLHTNPGVFGKLEPVGHVDFYVNGVSVQPFCSSHRNPPLCSHMLAARLFSESINSHEGVWGSPCPNFFQLLFGWCSFTPLHPDNALMGEHADTKRNGIFLINTDNNPPFAAGLRLHYLPIITIREHLLKISTN